MYAKPQAIQPQQQAEPKKTAEQHIADIRARFGKNSQGGLMYDNLPVNIKAMLCFGAKLSKAHIDMKLSDMNDFDRTKLHRVINELNGNLGKFATIPLSKFK